MPGGVPREAAQTVPGLRGRQTVAAVPEDAARALADDVTRHLGQRLRDAEVVHLALSGGSSGRMVCDALAASSELDAQAWARVHLWMVDERCVADEDPRLNFALVRDRLAPRLGLPRAHLHPMPVTAPDGAGAYQHELDAALAHSGGRLDAVVGGWEPTGIPPACFRIPLLWMKRRVRW